MVFDNKIITYGELRLGFKFDNDKYGIASYEYEPRRKAILANPNMGSDEDAYMYLVEADGIPVGRTTLFNTRLKIDNDIVPLYTGSSLEVEESFRKYGLGGEIFAYGGSIKNRKLFLAAGISDMALPLYKVSKYYIFEIPKYLRLQDSKPIIRKFGIKGILLSIISVLLNLILRVFYSFSKLKEHRLKKQYSIERVEIVPAWVDDIVLKDGHKYAEVHDHKWLQWNLDYNFKGHKRDIQSFFVIKKKNEAVGFVMTKERFRPDVQGMKDVMIGSIVEWGSKNERQLKESDIYRLVLNLFSNDIDIIETATNNKATQRELKWMGFIHHGDAHIAFRDKTKELKDSNNSNLWRFRYGYADVILS